MSAIVAVLKRTKLFEPIDYHLLAVLTGECKALGEPSSLFEVSTLLVSRATREGHACLSLSRFAKKSYLDAIASSAEDASELRTIGAPLSTLFLPDAESWASELVTAAGGAVRKVCSLPEGVAEDTACVTRSESTPLVLHEGRLYLERYYRHERELAELLLGRVDSARPAFELEQVKSALSRWTRGAPDLAKVAASIAVHRKLCVLSGGPGTGKTSTIVRLIGALRQLYLAAGKNAPRVLLLAPTGKAASRLSESIQLATARLAEELPEVASINATAMTVHRALLTGEYSNPREPLPLLADVVVIDEASMVDLSLMHRVLVAAQSAERLILVGDPDQLASVSTGAVLADLCSMAKGQYCSEIRREIEPTTEICVSLSSSAKVGVEDLLVELTESHRFKGDGGIGRLATAIRRGDVRGALDVLDRKDDAVSYIDLGKVSLDIVMDRIWAGYQSLRVARTAEAALTALDAYRVLCVHRRGMYGVETCNKRLYERAIQSARGSGRSTFISPTLVLENSEDGRLCNGDLGVLAQELSGMGTRAYFRETGGSANPIGASRLPRYERAYAMSVHKSQGSEVDEVLVILPEASSPLLSRELLYTAITRARHRCVIVGHYDALRRAIATKVTRDSGLSDALRHLGASARKIADSAETVDESL